LEFGAQGLGFGVWGLGFGVWGLGCGVRGAGFGVWGLGFRVKGLGVTYDIMIVVLRCTATKSPLDDSHTPVFWISSKCGVLF
jgi:hypothetical protein